MPIDYFLFYLQSFSMFTCPPSTSKSLPREFRSAAEKLFPSKGFTEKKGPSVDGAKAFSESLGIGEDFKRLWNAYKTNSAAGNFLDHFQNNRDLLIQKTWVEKADETRKENLQDQVPPFIALIEKGEYYEALKEFASILEELAYLFFGAQSQKDDFTEYTLRIDPHIGLFWWYGKQIYGARDTAWVKNADQNALYALLLLGICYLTNF
jgi:hypothetical protein